MKKSRFTEEQIIRILKEGEAGGKIDELCRRHDISQPTYYNWKSKYRGLEISDTKESMRSTRKMAWQRGKKREKELNNERGTLCPGQKNLMKYGQWTLCLTVVLTAAKSGR